MGEKIKASNMEEALIHALKSVVEAVIAMDPKSAAIFEQTFQYQKEHMRKQNNPEGVELFEQLRVQAGHPDRDKIREDVVKLFEEPPKGQA